MLISDLVHELTDVLAEHGDLDVFCWPYSGQSEMSEPCLNLDTADGAAHLRVEGALVEPFGNTIISTIEYEYDEFQRAVEDGERLIQEWFSLVNAASLAETGS